MARRASAGKVLASSREEPAHTSGLSDTMALYNYLYNHAMRRLRPDRIRGNLPALEVSGWQISDRRSGCSIMLTTDLPH
jgi:hypothetical protein